MVLKTCSFLKQKQLNIKIRFAPEMKRTNTESEISFLSFFSFVMLRLNNKTYLNIIVRREKITNLIKSFEIVSQTKKTTEIVSIISGALLLLIFYMCIFMRSLWY